MRYDHELEELARQLDADDNYRVVRRFTPRRRYQPDPDDRSILRNGLFVDVETTGLDPDTDRIIELALVPFTFAADGRLFTVGDAYDEFEDPGCPIPPEITALTGIRDEDVAGRRLNDTQINAMVGAAHIVIAHNAAFDRRFVEHRLPVFESVAWGCSMREIPWREEGIESGKLEYIAYRYGFFYDGHRAAVDCLAGTHVLAHQLPETGRPALAVLLDCARVTSYRLWAVDTPYEARIVLKARGYRWNSGDDGRPRAWFIDTDEARCAEESTFLLAEIYKRDLELRTDRITCFNRYSDRI